MTWSECIIAAHTAVTDQVSHGGRMKSKRYFDASECITWYLNSVQYEADRGIWHYEWRWTVTGCG